LLDRKKQACFENLLVWEETNPRLEQQAGQVLAKMASAEQARQRKRQRLSTVLGDGVTSSEHGGTVWLENQAWHPLIVHKGFIAVDSILDAEYFVFNDLSNMSMKVRWVLALGGGKAVTPDFFQTDGAACLAFATSQSSHRYLFISDGFKANHVAMYEIVQWAVKKHESKWSVVSLDTFVEQKRKVFKTRSESLGLATTREMKREPLLRLKHVYNGLDFLKFIAHHDHHASSSGLVL
jgi:hypothetical protein